MRNTPVCLKTENTRLSFIWSPLHVGSIWLIQVSIVTLLVGQPCHLSHTSHKKRTKSKQAQTYQNCEVCWKISNGFGRRLLIERTVSLLHISEQEEVLCTQKDWLSSYSKMLESKKSWNYLKPWSTRSLLNAHKWCRDSLVTLTGGQAARRLSHTQVIKKENSPQRIWLIFCQHSSPYIYPPKHTVWNNIFSLFAFYLPYILLFCHYSFAMPRCWNGPKRQGYSR